MRVMDNDNAKTMIGNTWFDVLFTFCIDDNANEAYHQNQNLIERRGGNLKKTNY